MLLQATGAPMVLPKEDSRRLEVLFFGAPTANGPHHDPITRYRVLKKGLGTEGINLTYLEDPAVVFSAATLDRYDALLMYGNWNQHEPMPGEQLEALLGYVRKGGGFVPVHCASACYGGSPEFVRLVGARFQSHGGEEFQVRNVQPNHPILRGLEGYKAWDETYVHDQQADDREVLQVRDKEPWTWTRREGEGRVFYTAGGHDHRVWDLKRWRIAHLVWDGIDGSPTAQARALYPFRVVRPGHPNHNKYVYDTLIAERQTAPRFFRMGNYYSEIPNNVISSNPNLVRNPFH